MLLCSFARLLISIRFLVCLKIAFRAFHLIYCSRRHVGRCQNVAHFSLHIQNQKLIFLVYILYFYFFSSFFLFKFWFSCSLVHSFSLAHALTLNHITSPFHFFSLYFVWLNVYEKNIYKCVCVVFLLSHFLVVSRSNSSICKTHLGTHTIFTAHKPRTCW